MCTASPPEPRALVPFESSNCNVASTVTTHPRSGRPTARNPARWPPRWRNGPEAAQNDSLGRRRASARQSGGDDRARAGAVCRRAPRRRRRPRPVRRAGRQRQRHAGRVPARRARARAARRARGAASTCNDIAPCCSTSAPPGGARRTPARRACTGRASTWTTTSPTSSDVREHLGIERWIVFGVSWGSVLGATYAERHPDRVTAVVLAAVSTGTADDIDWLTVHAGRFFPAEWHASSATTSPRSCAACASSTPTTPC